MSTNLFAAFVDLNINSLCNIGSGALNVVNTLDCDFPEISQIQSSFLNNEVLGYLYPLLENLKDDAKLNLYTRRWRLIDQHIDAMASATNLEDMLPFTVPSIEGSPDSFTQHAFIHMSRGLPTLRRELKKKKFIQIITKYHSALGVSDDHIWVRELNNDGVERTILFSAKKNYSHYRIWLATLPSLISPLWKPDTIQKDQELVEIVKYLATGTEHATLDQMLAKYLRKHYYDRESAFRKILTNMQQEVSDAYVQQLQSEITYKTQERNNFLNSANNIQHKIMDLQQKLAGIQYLKENVLAEEDIELLLKMKYITEIERAHSVSKDDVLLHIRFRAPLNIIDIQTWQSYTNTERMNTFKAPGLEVLYNAIFIKQTWQLFTQWNTFFNLTNLQMNPGNHPSGIIDYAIPQPHLNTHSCYGDAIIEINKALCNMDLITAISQVVYAGQQLNVTDHHVSGYFNRFLQDNLENEALKLYNPTLDVWKTLAEVIEYENKENEQNESDIDNTGDTSEASTGLRTTT